MEEKRFINYTDKVIERIGCDRRTGRKIKEDLLETLIMKSSETGEEDPYALMGDIDEVAEEFKESLNIKDNYYNYTFINRKPHYEYKSKTTIGGIPLIHVISGRGVAKGIIAIGPVAIGVFALGLIPIGIASLGVIALGLLVSLGSIGISPLISLGGVAVSYYLSLGGVAIAKHFAIGGLAVANVAIGGVAKGIIAVYKQKGSGQFLYPYYTDASEIIAQIKILYPNISSTVSEIIEFVIKSL